jgi:hypothetical protein
MILSMPSMTLAPHSAMQPDIESAAGSTGCARRCQSLQLIGPGRRTAWGELSPFADHRAGAMSPTFVLTSAWWLDATPQACWPLLSDASGWPVWWRSIASVDERKPTAPLAPHQSGIWLACWGTPLRLSVTRRLLQPFDLVEWQVDGDVQGQLTWVLAGVPSGGCDVTCRWELATKSIRPTWLLALSLLLVERSHFARMRACALDLGARLACRVSATREWSGRTRS